MTWVRLDDAFADHPKVDGLSDGAFRLLVSGFCHSGRHLTDGFIAADRVARLVPRFRKAHVDELVNGGLWHEAEGGWVIHDWHDCNPSAAEVRTKREVRSAAGRLGGLRSGQSRRANSEADASANAPPNGEHRGSSKREPRPVPSLSTESSNGSSRGDPPAVDDEKIEAVLGAFADLKRRTATVHGSEANWRATVIRNARLEHGVQIRNLLDQFDVSPTRIASVLVDGRVPPDFAHHRRQPA